MSATDPQVDEAVAPNASPAHPAPLARVVIKQGRARPLFGRHPWVFAGSIDYVQGEEQDGAEVAVVTHSGEFIARGLYNTKSQIRTRLYCWEPDRPLDAAFWRQRLSQAIELRRDVLHLDDPPTACRLVFSEGDGLSGLVVDRYGPWLAVQLTSLALARRLTLLVDLLVEQMRPQGIYLRTERGIGQAEGLELMDGLLWGDVPPETVPIIEHGLEYAVDLREGQKTGFYLDQRENRGIVAPYAAGRRVLDVFCYTGGFALAAARAGAAEVVGIDVSRPAIELARRNAERNGLANVRFETADAFGFMQQLADTGERFGMVILDPPKFARHTRAVADALRGYQRANLLAAKLLESGGILVTCSCSGHVSREQFAAVLGAVAQQSSRPIQILAQLGQAPDHPVSASCLETAYLKCLIARVV